MEMGEGRREGRGGKSNFSTYFFIPVQRVDDELHHPVDLRLKGVFLCRVSELLHFRHTQAVQFNGFLLSGRREGVSE